MTTPVIYCPGPDRWLTIAQYVKAVKLAQSKPDATFSQGLTCFWPCTGAEVMRQFRRGLNDRISQATSYSWRSSQ